MIDAAKTAGPMTPKRRRRRVLLVVVLLLAIFHRPLLHEIIGLVVAKIVAREHIRLSYTMEGSVFTGVTLKNVRGGPLPGQITPVEKISIERVHLDYSLLTLLRRGPDFFLKNLEASNLEIVARDVDRPDRPKREPSLAKNLRDFFHAPVFAADRVSARNINITVHARDGDLVLSGADALFDPHAKGSLRVARFRLPNGREWKNLAAVTTTANRSIRLHDLSFDEGVWFESIRLDASGRGTKTWSASFAGKFFGGDASGSLRFQDAVKNARVDWRGAARDLDLGNLIRYFEPRSPVAGRLLDFSLESSGDPDLPRSWKTRAIAHAQPFVIDQLHTDRATVQINDYTGQAELVAGENRLVIHAHTQPPERLAGFVDTEFIGDASLVAPALQQVAPKLSGGALSAAAAFTLRHRKFVGRATASAQEIASKDFALQAADATIQVSKNLAQPRESEFFDGLESKIGLAFKDLRVRDYAADSGRVQLETRSQRTHVEEVMIVRAENTISAHGDCDLPRRTTTWADSFFDADFSIHAPRVNAFNSEPKLTGVNGQLEAKGHLSHRGTFDGNITAVGSGIAFQELSAETLNVDVAIQKSVATVNALDLRINRTDHVAARGTFALQKPFDYDGTLDAQIKDLAFFQPLLRASGRSETVGGSLALDWSGNGSASPPQHSGKGQLELRKARYGAIEITEAKLDGLYFPGTANFPIFHIVSNQGALDGVLDLLEGKLRFHDIAFQRGGEKLTGYFILPIDLARIGQPGLFPMDQRIAAVLNATALDLDKVATSFGKKSPVSGTVTANIFAGGTLANPTAHLKLAARDLKSKKHPAIEPTDLDANLHFSQNKFTLAATVKQRQLQPIDVRGKIPFDIQSTLAAKHLDPKTPVELKIKLPKSPATALAQFAPIVRFVEGQMALDAQIAGTIGQPQLSGAATFDLPAVRLRDPAMPAVNGFRADLRFTESRVVIERFSGDVSGGPFSLAGKIGFEKLTAPMLDLHFRSQNLLIARNESLTIRADGDLKIAGPHNAASVTGNAALTKCRFVRDIEILPIELPGRPAPKAPRAATGFSLKAPFADWKFNIVIKTKDPFLIRGNLTNGVAEADVRLVGTGAAPTLDGMIRFDRLVAALPFSKLEVERGFVYYSPDEPFEPRLDIQGSSNMRDYNIGVYIFGTASRPQTILSSEPPLPQDEIVSLLATGTTRKELAGAGNRDVIAGRAAVLAFQEVYRKVFKRKPAGDNESFLNRFAIDVGAVDPRTGKQQVSTRFKLGENFYLIGDVDVQGDIRGQVKYLMRFR